MCKSHGLVRPSKQEKLRARIGKYGAERLLTMDMVDTDWALLSHIFNRHLQ
jgi:hypothetical protein